MKKILLSVALMMATFSLHATDANYQVVPLPQSVTAEKGAPFVLEVFTSINVAAKMMQCAVMVSFETVYHGGYGYYSR